MDDAVIPFVVPGATKRKPDARVPVMVPLSATALAPPCTPSGMSPRLVVALWPSAAGTRREPPDAIRVFPGLATVVCSEGIEVIDGTLEVDIKPTR